ncbi:adenosylmethionine decarboxylase [Desulfobacter hydrogenophilus]|uniref:S-adenosylmethionine decarboxylase proenzyme n=1 Tax=Desulfobacter hydrogenophilus TaxID=2291 RepID=A0A328FB71_9BACT|nr:adenosylmethionine decarboxylase [Desulfobacter hydrogenophilus]NDY72506.1 adenosylmethionine decarboxylase [Desulfobacter hydrogenophilus]QBH14163.1 adenosylmethionine decarboxylase [Desulfobacter hydrogenophilus]RAM01549.1 adenosylmethionine decarboxylase [Desulfobacter hydrogenophilus]
MLDKNKKRAVYCPDPSFALGRHITIEYYDCASNVLLDKDGVESILLKAARESGATIISSSFHQFEPQGVSGVVIIAESHFTVHAWPEHNYAAVDIFTCADNIDLDTAIHSIEAQLSSQRVFISSDQNRGILQPGFGGCTPNSDEKVMDRRTLPIAWKKVCENAHPWGMSTSVDLYDCSPDKIKDPDAIKNFVGRVCGQLGIVDIENAPLVYYDETETAAGFSMKQSIETSGISGHFAHATNAAYLDIFSCNTYEPRELAEFSLSYFRGSHYKMQVALRQ